ncbi:hypothetical protein [Geodermatophilus sp. SYSU D01176]
MTAVPLDAPELQGALLRGAVGDHAAEAAVLLLVNTGHWLAQLQSSGLIDVFPDASDPQEPLAARIRWADVMADLTAAQGRLRGGATERRLLTAAASIGGGQPLDLCDLCTGLGRSPLGWVWAAMAHAAGTHEQHAIVHDEEDLPGLGAPLGPLFPWPEE